MEAYAIYRGRYIFGLGELYAIVASGRLDDGRAFSEQFVLQKGKPLVAQRVKFSPGVYSSAEELLQDSLEGIRGMVEALWQKLDEDERHPDDLSYFDLRMVSRGRLMWIKKDNPVTLEQVSKVTLCSKLREDLATYLAFEFESESIGPAA